MSGDICDWLAEEEAAAEQWGGLGGAQFYRERFAAARAEIERLRALVDSVLACDGSDRTTHVTVEIPFDLYHELEEARRV